MACLGLQKATALTLAGYRQATELDRKCFVVLCGHICHSKVAVRKLMMGDKVAFFFKAKFLFFVVKILFLPSSQLIVTI